MNKNQSETPGIDALSIEENSTLQDPAVRKAIKKAQKKQAALQAKAKLEAEKKECIAQEQQARATAPLQIKNEKLQKEQDDDLLMFSPSKQKAIRKAREQAAAKEKREYGKQVEKLAEEENKKIFHTTFDAYPVRFYHFTKNGGYYELADKSYMDILQIHGRSYYTATEGDLERMIANATHLQRMYKESYKIYWMNFPTNTKPHRDYLERVIERTTNPEYADRLKRKIEQYEALEKNSLDQQFFFCLFAEHAERLAALKNLLAVSPIQTEEISYQKKKLVLRKLNNMSEIVKI